MMPPAPRSPVTSTEKSGAMSVPAVYQACVFGPAASTLKPTSRVGTPLQPNMRICKRPRLRSTFTVLELSSGSMLPLETTVMLVTSSAMTGQPKRSRVG
jgi:hypothetical protein